MSETTENPGGEASPGVPPAAAAAPPPRLIDIVRRQRQATRRELRIPEWENQRLFFSRLTVNDMETVGARDSKSTLDRNLHLVIVKAELEDGTPAFQTGDLPLLKREADFTVVQRIIDFMFAAASGLPGSEEEADRIAQDPISGSA
jgi:hypothetical protein